MSLSNQEHHRTTTKIDDSIFYGSYDEFNKYVYKLIFEGILFPELIGYNNTFHYKLFDIPRFLDLLETISALMKQRGDIDPEWFETLIILMDKYFNKDHDDISFDAYCIMSIKYRHVQGYIRIKQHFEELESYNINRFNDGFIPFHDKRTALTREERIQWGLSKLTHEQRRGIYLKGNTLIGNYAPDSMYWSTSSSESSEETDSTEY